MAAAGVAFAVSEVAPLLGPLLVALILGAVVANTPRLSGIVTSSSATTANRMLLRWGVVLLGLKVAVADVVGLGVAGITVVLVTVAVTFTVTQVAGRALGLSADLTTLIASGFSICGAAAIAAVESSIRGRAKDVALAVALVTVFGSAMIVVIPTLGGVLGLSHDQTAVWAGASIHEVAQVIAAASLISGGGAVALAMTVKLGRVALLAPVQMGAARACAEPPDPVGPSGSRTAMPPLFLLGFLLAVAVRSTGLLPARALDAAGGLTTLLLAAAMYGLGTGIVARHLWPLSGRAVGLAAIATLTAAGTSLVLVAAFV